ncbi:lytic transglycosylase domain-containing protein [Arcobacter lacus]|uniref:lytic transglycosylase domain-containing protein n=1 Tax=Arcobacter lacus TaxID=1912876 RepID=UPI0021BB6B48|nr:lytic transglycosylase domain-containing protein [Arcobacter lacus]MCT7910715.1 lytic transglycosylase domain-containing protein [Arcobacter lacus]
MIDLAFIEQCKNQNVDINIVQKIMQVESNKNPFAINVNKDGKSYISFSPKTKEEASKIAGDYISKGFSVDLGLMQFNSNNLSLKAFSNLTINDLLDPCINIKAGSDIFYLAYENTNMKLAKEERIKMALSVYNTGNEENGFKNGYVAKYDNVPTLSLIEQARKSDTKLNLSYSLFNLEALKNKKED